MFASKLNWPFCDDPLGHDLPGAFLPGSMVILFGIFLFYINICLF